MTRDGFAADHAQRPFNHEELAVLIHDLAMVRWAPGEMYELFTHPDISKIDELVKINVLSPIILKHDKYQHYLSKSSLEKARRFKSKWRTTLMRADHSYQVDPDVITAILLVETQLGRLRGSYPLIAVFASIYIDTSMILQDRYQLRGLSGAMIQRIQRKRNWAFGELNALLSIRERYPDADILSFKGSYAGAFGMCQFLPSSYLRWGVASFGGKAPDLDWEPDAIFSIASYLSSNGFSKNDQDLQRKAIWHYNNSDVYVDTVMAVREALQRSRLLAKNYKKRSGLKTGPLQ